MEVYSSTEFSIKIMTDRLRKLTCMSCLTVSSCLMGSSVGRCHLSRSQIMVLLNAKPDISAWNLPRIFSVSPTCHPTTLELLQIGPSKRTSSLLCTNLAVVHVPIRLHSVKYRQTHDLGLFAENQKLLY